ncbi:MAG: MerR family transcriptional regulator [Gemmatimonadota bacterium]|nr:MerR family transcriptional regulator [Gemmatimonadota bacterium]
MRTDIVGSIPVREFFSIGDVCDLTDLKPHVLRYWESQFRFLHPAKNRSGNRVYQRREVELIVLVKELLYVDKYTIEGARARIDEYRKTGNLKAAARAALEGATVDSIEAELQRIVAALDGVDVDDAVLESSGTDEETTL